MRKYKKAIRRILHMFNMGKKSKNVHIVCNALNAFWGMELVAMADSEVSLEDFDKMQALYNAMDGYTRNM